MSSKIWLQKHRSKICGSLILFALPGSGEAISLNQIKEALLVVTKPYHKALKESDNWKQTGENILTARRLAENLSQFSGDAAVDVCAIGVTSYDTLVVRSVVQSLPYLGGRRALALMELILTKHQTLYPENVFPKEIVENISTEAPEALARIIGSGKIPRAMVDPRIIVETLSTQNTNETYRKVAKGLVGCTDRCMPAVEAALSNEDPFVRGFGFKGLQHLNGPKVMALIESGLTSVEHPEKEGASYALVGRSGLEILSFIKIAITAQFSKARFYGYIALSKLPLENQEVINLYRDGLRDANKEVRIPLLWALVQREELLAWQLIKEVSRGDLPPRSDDEQMARVPERDLKAESLRTKLTSLSPNVSYMETFDIDKINRRKKNYRDPNFDTRQIALQLVNTPISDSHVLPGVHNALEIKRCNILMSEESEEPEG